MSFWNHAKGISDEYVENFALQHLISFFWQQSTTQINVNDILCSNRIE
jgi:hypothetical protein